MIQLKDVPIYISLFLLIAYIAAGNTAINYLGGMHLFMVHFMIFLFLREYKNRTFRMLGISINSVLIIFTFMWYFLKIEIDNFFSSILFVIFMAFVVIKNKWF